MRVLFIHRSFPAQYQHVVAALAARPDCDVAFITQDRRSRIPGVTKVAYAPDRAPAAGTHQYVRRLEAGALNGQAVLRAARALERQGFRPDLVVGHSGWGEILYIKDLWPDVPLLGYFEFYYRQSGADVGFDPEYPVGLDDLLRLRTNNALNLLGLEAADWGQTATFWQKSLHPERYHDALTVLHEGIDTVRVRPDPAAAVVLADRRRVLTRRDEVVTYVARDLEPYRGFHTFMRALPEIQRRRPKAHVLIVGGDGVSYGQPPPGGRNYRHKLLDEVGAGLDLSRIHFLGQVPYDTYLRVLQVSSAHVYLTYPFVLSWSLLEAMAAGCVVVGSATPPVEEVVRHRDNGLLVDFFSPPDVADTVDEVLEHAGRMPDLGLRARQSIVGRYDLHTICLPRHLRLIETLAEGRRPD